MRAKYLIRDSEGGGLARSGLRSFRTTVIASCERLRLRRLGEGERWGGNAVKNCFHNVVQSLEIQP